MALRSHRPEVMTRPILAALLWCCLVPLCAHGQGPVLQQYANPNAPDSSDNDPSLLGKILLALQPASAGPASQVGATHGANGWVTALADGTSASFSRPTRRRILYLNTSSSEIVYAGFASGVNATTGFPINPGTTLIQTSVVPMYFYSADGAARVAWLEAFD